MPAKSKQQQKFMGIVRSIQKGDAPASKFSKAAQKVAKSMKKSDVKKYAKTKHDDLPKKVRENEQKLREYIRKEIIKIKESMNEVSIGDRMANRRIQQIRKYFDQQYKTIKNAVERDARTGSKEFRNTDNRGEKYKLTVVINRLKELRNKLSRKDRGLADMFTKNITPIEKVKDKMKEGTCGYGLDGNLGEEPAGPHLIKKKKKTVKEDIEMSKGVKKLMKIADEGYGKVGGTTVDSMSASLFKQIYNKVNDDIKQKLNTKNEKQLVRIIGGMWKKFGKNVSIGSGL